MRRLLLGLLVLAGFSACTPVSSPALCPVVVTWSNADQEALKQGLNADPNPLVHRAVREDAGFRAWARACAKGHRSWVF